MDGSAAAGNLSAASSGPLPAPADGETLLGVSEKQEENQDQGSKKPEENQRDRESRSQNKQSPAETPVPPTEKQKPEGSSEVEPNPDQPGPENTSTVTLELRKTDPDSGQPELTEKPLPQKLDSTKPDTFCSDHRNKGPAESEQEPGPLQNQQNHKDQEAEGPPHSSEDLTGGVKESKTIQNLHDLAPLLEQTPPPPAADQQAPPLNIVEYSEQVWPRPSVSSSGEPKLCGYLLKQAGPLRNWKQRWFTYEEKKNQLFYYRTPQDVTPLGRVNLGGATFTYPLKAEKGTFHIRTPERTFILKVGCTVLHR